MTLGGRRGRAWDSFGLSRVAIIINSPFLTNDRVFALPRIKGPGFAGRRMRLIFLTGAGGRAQSAARFPLRCLNGDPANRVPDVSMDGANHPRSLARPHYVRTYRSEPSYRCHCELPREQLERDPIISFVSRSIGTHFSLIEKTL